MKWIEMYPGILRSGAVFRIDAAKMTTHLQTRIQGRKVTKLDLLMAIRGVLESAYGEPYFETLGEWVHRELKNHIN